MIRIWKYLYFVLSVMFYDPRSRGLLWVELHPALQSFEARNAAVAEVLIPGLYLAFS